MTIDVTVVGGGMITHDLLLPSLFQMQRSGTVGTINVCALDCGPLKTLAQSPIMREAFPEQTFVAHPGLSEDPAKTFPGLYRDVIAAMKPRQVVVVAMPDQLHNEVVTQALNANQHVLCVKPLVLKYDHTVEIEHLARDKGLFVGVEYHKRFDRRSLMARHQYDLGHLGQFVMGEAKMIEPYYYRASNFQNWFTCDRTDPFVYVGCHYVDLVSFITRLRPVEVSVQGVKGRFPNGNEGYMWAHGRVKYENGALLSVTDGLGYPDAGAGANEQCLEMFFEGPGKTGMIKHDDQDRGVQHCYLDGVGAGGSRFNFVSPDFFRLVPWQGPGLKAVGYGFESVAATIDTVAAIEAATAGLPVAEAIERRRQLCQDVDARGLIATPANSYINELVVEAARLSIVNDGLPARIVYGEKSRVELRVY